MIRKLWLIAALCLSAGCVSSTESVANTGEVETYVHSEHGCEAFTECGDETAGVSDTGDFKAAYESLNGTENASGKIHRTITIAEDHPFVYATEQEVLDRFDSKEDFYLYVGDAKCPWCRVVIETAISKAKEHGVTEILYLPIWDAEGNEILRDKYTLEDGKAVQINSGTVGYWNLLKRLDSVLEEYTLSDDDTEIKVGEKRIYAPSYFKIENSGAAVTMVTGIPSGLEDPRAELTDEQLAETEEVFEEFFS